MQWILRSRKVFCSVQNTPRIDHQVPPDTLWWCDQPMFKEKTLQCDSLSGCGIGWVYSVCYVFYKHTTAWTAWLSRLKAHYIVVVFILRALAVVNSVGSWDLLDLSSCACQADQLWRKLCMRDKISENIDTRKSNHHNIWCMLKNKYIQ